jgi:hypothetical protein
VRGKQVITPALDRHRWDQIEDGAVLERDAIIATGAALFTTAITIPGRMRLLPPELEDIGAHAPLRRDTTIVGV